MSYFQIELFEKHRYLTKVCRVSRGVFCYAVTRVTKIGQAVTSGSATKYKCTSGPGCSKQKTSLVNDSLNFRKLISQICLYFLLKNVRHFCIAKTFLIFSTKNISVFG